MGLKNKLGVREVDTSGGTERVGSYKLPGTCVRKI